MDSDDKPDSSSPSYDMYLRAEVSNGVLRYTNFTPQEFDNLWSRVELYVAQHWSTGRGKKPSNSGKDVFFMSISALKHCGK
ncbi:hypothetical protein PR003_g5044 [Phytophthora rubi]|uniref:Uncharacterized protein n=1 Tax=Phytophthora rubi TaxID=129364 RepID=A0A6A3NVU4_9STRA|nr:hypothetical protein PR002_g1166 [Phytophthora rubi]KAE9351096.1 hypothetical protein PR003_g5044 [Phytophthora rubi]